MYSRAGGGLVPMSVTCCEELIQMVPVSKAGDGGRVEGRGGGER